MEIQTAEQSEQAMTKVWILLLILVLTGKKAPAFKAPVIGGSYGEGDTVSLADLKGQTVVLYFYPKDDTPGCTAQACALRDGWSRIKKRAAVFGVSVDPLQSHAKFIKKHSLPFPLISDETKEIVQAYGVWVGKATTRVECTQ